MSKDRKITASRIPTRKGIRLKKDQSQCNLLQIFEEPAPSTQNRRTYAPSRFSDHAFGVLGDITSSTFHFYQADAGPKLSEDEERKKNEEFRQKKYETLLESLNFSRMGARVRNVDDALRDTCRWFLNHRILREWIDDSKTSDNNGFLWIKGKPGSGKSTLMKLLFQNAQKTWQSETSVSYFFNGRAAGELEKSSLGLYRSLTHQILLAVPETKVSFLQTFGGKESQGRIVDEWSATELKGFLLNLLATWKHRTLNIFIDALDEGTDDDIRQMVAFLEQLSIHALSLSTRLRICLSSRYYPHISVRKGLCFMIDQELQHTQDIQTYVHELLNYDLHELSQELCEKSAGIFLWIVLVVPMLNCNYDEGGNLKTAKTLLNDLPVDLDSLFYNILSRSTNNVDECVSLFQWVLFSEQPMTAQEVYVALQYSKATLPSSNISMPDDDRLHRYLLHRSRGLVDLTTYGTLQLIHETARTFLLGVYGFQQVEPKLRLNIEGISHDKLRRACYLFFKHNNLAWNQFCEAHETSRFPLPLITWPCSESHVMTNRRDLPPFVRYAANNLLVHANVAQTHGISQSDFLGSMQSDGTFALWRRFHHHFAGDRKKQGGYSDMTALYVAVVQNLKHLACCLIDKGVNVNEVGGFFGSPLGAACASGSVDLMRLLLENDAVVDWHGAGGSDAFLAGIYLQESEKAAEIVRLLDDYAQLLPPLLLSTALVHSAGSNKVECARALLDAHADLIAGNSSTQLLLTTESLYWSDEKVKMIELLLSAGVDVNAKEERGRTALHAAAKFGCRKAMQALLSAGADVNAIDEEGQSVLQAAVSTGRADNVEFLIHAGANVNTNNYSSRTALHVASQSNLTDTVEVLANAGADPGA